MEKFLEMDLDFLVEGSFDDEAEPSAIGTEVPPIGSTITEPIRELAFAKAMPSYPTIPPSEV